MTFKVSFFAHIKLCHTLFASREYTWKWRMTATLHAYSYHSPAPSSRTSSVQQSKKLKTPKNPQHLTYELTEEYCYYCALHKYIIFSYEWGTVTYKLYGSHMQSRKFNKSIQKLWVQDFCSVFLKEVNWSWDLILLFPFTPTRHFVFPSPNLSTNCWIEQKLRK